MEANGVSYKKGYAVITGINELSRYPVFHIIEIFIQNSNVILGLLGQETVQFCPHYRAWMIQQKSSKKLIGLNTLHSRQCLLPRPLPNALHIYRFITLKYAVD